PTVIQNNDYADNQIQRRLSIQSDQSIGSDTQMAKFPCEIIGSLIQFLVGKALAFIYDRDRLRGLFDPLFKQLMDAGTETACPLRADMTKAIALVTILLQSWLS